VFVCLFSTSTNTTTLSILATYGLDGSSQGRLVLNVQLLVLDVHILLFTFIWFITLCFNPVCPLLLPDLFLRVARARHGGRLHLVFRARHLSGALLIHFIVGHRLHFFVFFSETALASALDQVLLDRQQILLTFGAAHLVVIKNVCLGVRGCPLFLGLLSFLVACLDRSLVLRYSHIGLN